MAILARGWLSQNVACYAQKSLRISERGWLSQKEAVHPTDRLDVTERDWFVVSHRSTRKSYIVGFLLFFKSSLVYKNYANVSDVTF